MLSQFAGAILISLLHGLIPSHWLPIVAIGKKMHWTAGKVMLVTFQAALVHALSTVIIGFGVAFLGHFMNSAFESFTRIAPAIILIALGIWFIYRHYTHHHFHLHPDAKTKGSIIFPILLAMFLSPCLEIEGYFFSLGAMGWNWVLLLAFIYILLTVGSMLGWVYLAFHGLKKLNAHKWEHNAGMITGIVLAISGLLFLIS